MENGSDGEFEDSRDNLAPENQLEPPTSTPEYILGPTEVTAPPQSNTSFISMGGPILSGEVDINQVGDGALSQEDLIEDAKGASNLPSVEYPNKR